MTVEDLFPSALPSEPGPPLTTIERAFELARGGAYVRIEDLVAQLKAERYEAVDALLFDPAVRLQLRQACAEGRQSAARARGLGPIG
jgi:hypothetical protein